MPRIQPLVSLLRPLAAPRSVTCRQHFRFSTATRLCDAKPSIPPATSSKPTAPSQAPPTAPTTPQEAARAADLAAAEAITESDSAQPPEPKPDLPSQRAEPSPAASHPKKATQTPSAVSIDLPPPKYHVARSISKNLPIYTDYKRGGNLHLTTVRKVSGDASALRDELRVLLKKPEGEVTVNSVTGHVVVKGHHTAPIKEFLEQRGM